MRKGSVLDLIQTFVIVTIVTLLVWLFADTQIVKVYENQQLWVEFFSPNEDLVIEPANEKDRIPALVLLSYRASSGEKAELDKRLSNTIRIEVSEKPDEPEQTIILKEEIDKALTNKRGLTLIKTEPPTLRLIVERLQTEELPIEIDLQDVREIQFHKYPIAEPDTVKMTIRASLAQELQGLKAIAVLKKSDLTTEVGVEHTVPNVPIQMPETLKGRWTDRKPSTVAVNYAILERADTELVKTVPITLMGPPPLFDEFKIEVSESERVLELNLRGPADIIEDIKTDQTKIHAVIWLKRSEVEIGRKSYPLIIVASPDIKYEAAQTWQAEIQTRLP